MQCWLYNDNVFLWSVRYSYKESKVQQLLWDRRMSDMLSRHGSSRNIFFLLKEIIAKGWEWNHLGCVFPWCGQCDLTRPPHWRNRPIYPDPIFATWESWALREVARNWMKENRRAADLVDQQSSWPTMWQQHQQYTLTTKTPSRVTTTRNVKIASE